MKYIILFFIIFARLTLAQFSGGTGVEGDPYLVATPIQLDSMRFYATQAWFEQIADIDLSGIANWNPVGNGDTLWNSNFDGNNFLISNLTITSGVVRGSAYSLGLFGVLGGFYVGGRHITRVHLQNIRITGDYGGTYKVYAGGLVGKCALSTSSPSRTTIDSCLVDTISIKITGTASPFIGGLIGENLLGNYLTVFQCGVENDSLTQTSGGTPLRHIGGFIGRMSGNGGITESWVKNSYIYGNRSENNLGGFVGGHYIGSITNCYTLNAEVIDNVTTNFWKAGTFAGSKDASINNCYATGTTTYSADLGTKTGFFGHMGGTGGGNFFDKDVAGTTNTFAFDSAGATSVYPKTTDSMKVAATFEWRGWDFDTTWSISVSLNNSYPNLEGIFYEGYTLNYPSEAGLFFIEDSVITITWSTDIPQGTPEGTDTTLIYFVYNGAVFIDTVFNNDTTYSWTLPPDIFTEIGRILIHDVDSTYSDSSDFFFTLIQAPENFSQVDIFDVTTLPFVTGDTLSVFVETIYVDSLNLFWSKDSIVWFFISPFSVDTVNGSFKDTTIALWEVPYEVSGIIHVRATEVRDTSRFFVDDTLKSAGNHHQNLFCLYDEGGDINRRATRFDPSCGWSQPNWSYFLNLMREKLDEPELGYVRTQNDCPHPYTALTCVTPKEPQYVIRYGGDSIFVSAPSVEATQFIYKSRRYFVSGELVRVEDLINNVTQTLIDFTGLYQSTPVLIGYYNKPLKAFQQYADGDYSIDDQTYYFINHTALAYDDALHQRLLDSLGQTFGNYDEGYVLVAGNVASTESVHYASLYPEAINVFSFSQDDYSLVDGGGGISRRDWFRGIHPKIWKNGVR